MPEDKVVYHTREFVEVVGYWFCWDPLTSCRRQIQLYFIGQIIDFIDGGYWVYGPRVLRFKNSYIGYQNLSSGDYHKYQLDLMGHQFGIYFVFDTEIKPSTQDKFNSQW